MVNAYAFSPEIRERDSHRVAISVPEILALKQIAYDCQYVIIKGIYRQLTVTLNI